VPKFLKVSDERLGDELLDVGINWEHFVASNNDKMIPGDPLKVNDVKLQAKIDSLDEIFRGVGQRNQFQGSKTCRGKE